MTYSTIQPPFTLDFPKMSTKDLKDYSAWFHGVLPQRVIALGRAVQETTGFEAWQPDFTASSLDLLGDWFATQVETRPRSQEEIQEIASRSLFPVEIPGEELTNRTFSLAMDVGMYLSQVFLKNYPALRWDQLFRNRKDADFGQPVLIGFGAVALNPVWLLVTLAYGLVSKRRTGKSLRDLYEIWAKMTT